MSEAEFHWREGWYFKRLEDGSVRVRVKRLLVTIPPNEWGSIVASVSPRGDTATTYAAAMRLHNPEPEPAAQS